MNSLNMEFRTDILDYVWRNLREQLRNRRVRSEVSDITPHIGKVAAQVYSHTYE